MKQPKLRFKADGGMQFPDWGEKKIGELGTFTKGAPLSKADISDCGTPLILYGELYTTYNEVAYDIQRKTQSTVDEKYYSLVGDVVIPTSGETAEEISTATCVMAQNVILAGDLNIYRSDIVEGRIMSYILNHQAKWKIARLAQGKSIVHIQAAQLSDITIKYPPSTVEQKKIASLFTELDTLIQSAEKELEGYRELKQGMLQKMFPKKGEKVPEIRFPEFAGDWEQRKLGEICGQLKNTINPMDTPDDYYIEYSMPAFDDNETATCVVGKTMNSARKVIDKPCLLVNKLNVRKKRIWNVENPESNAVCSAEFVPLYSLGADLTFVKYTLFTDDFTSYLEDRSSGSSNSQKRVTPEVIMQAKVTIPTCGEQKKIGEYFSNLDNLIFLQQKELDGYKELKKGLLQQMFC